MSKISRSEAQLYGDLLACFDHAAGQRVVDWMRKTLGEGETLTLEEMHNDQVMRGEREGVLVPVDTNSFMLREGQRRAFRKIHAMIEKATSVKGKL